jgi:hypothetical protein
LLRTFRSGDGWQFQSPIRALTLMQYCAAARLRICERLVIAA